MATPSKKRAANDPPDANDIMESAGLSPAHGSISRMQAHMRDADARIDESTWLYKWRREPSPMTRDQTRDWTRALRVLRGAYGYDSEVRTVLCDAFAEYTVPEYLPTGGFFVLDASRARGELDEDDAAPPGKRFLDYLLPRLQPALQADFSAFLGIVKGAAADKPPARSMERRFEPLYPMPDTLADIAHPTHRIKVKGDAVIVSGLTESSRIDAGTLDAAVRTSTREPSFVAKSCLRDKEDMRKESCGMIQRLLGLQMDISDPLQGVCTALFDLTLAARADSDVKNALGAALAQLIYEPHVTTHQGKLARFWDFADRNGWSTMLVSRGFCRPK